MVGTKSKTAKTGTEHAEPETEMNGTTSPINLHKDGMVKKEEEGGGGGGGEDKASPPQQQPPQQQPSQQQQHVTSEASSLADSNGSVHEDTDDIKPLNMMIMTSPAARSEVKGHNDRKRRASSDSLDSLQTKASESAADDASKDDDEENDDDDDEKMSSSHDPERLKAFNMFVRLFVDENLDRIVPISKQPKDKIQAILDACDRQFPEFHERSRKRIRTYLKSCRRMRRSKDTNGWDQLRPTPPHLTSAAAESILAMACENESNNAKRMRMGLEPLPMSAMVSSQSAVNIPTQPVSSACASPTQAPPVGAHAHGHQPPCLEKQTPSIGSFRAAHELPSPFITNSNGVFRPTFTNNYHNTGLATHIQNGPTDLSMKKPSLSSPSSKNQLNSSEVAAIRQLIAGYRESAAFLYRSADELEQLLLHQN